MTNYRRDQPNTFRPLLDQNAVAAILGVQVKTLESWRLRGRGIPFLKVGRCVRYRASAVEAFLKASERQSTSDPGPAAP